MTQRSVSAAAVDEWQCADEGEFDVPCAVCGARPATVRVLRWVCDLDGAQKLGEAARAESGYFCAAHRQAALAGSALTDAGHSDVNGPLAARR